VDYISWTFVAGAEEALLSLSLFVPAVQESRVTG
jgi:hypothetical protein